MSLPVIAIVVASLSALFTGGNVTVSLASYRRGRPRLSVKYTLDSLSFEPIEGRWWLAENYLNVHVVNRGQAAVTVHDVQVIFRYPRPQLRLSSIRKLKSTILRPRFELPSPAIFHEGNIESEIPPFGGARWIVQRRANIIPRPNSFEEKIKVAVRVTLTNGAEVTSRWKGITEIQEQDENLRQNVKRWLEREQTNPGQLAFEDLLRKAGK
ncbi:hypothetical protein [Streptomyces sp. NPDC127072]|uniref:hypothetical protein n=1 Tax=Streptomyces sp. NPDC127072 TaxID=3347129 RepID=UPI003661C2C3